MIFHTTSSFRQAILSLTKRVKDGYSTVVEDICRALQDMPDNIIRDTNDRIIQQQNYRIVKLRIPNSGQRLAKANGFRLIYYVSLVDETVVLLHVYPKRGPQGVGNITDAEYNRLIGEMIQESTDTTLHQVDVTDNLAELSTEAHL
jgi:mRNA-degrading endonuclease RelE of RelBE toxin-antitoxin system